MQRSSVMSDQQSPAGQVFEQSDRPSWMAGASTSSTSNDSPTADPLNQEWQAFMTYDHLSPTATLPLSYLLPPESTRGLSATDVPTLTSPQLVTTSEGNSFTIPQGVPASVAFNFSNIPVSQDFDFTSPEFGTHVSPFSDTSRHISDEVDLWDKSDALRAPSFTARGPALSPLSDISPIAPYVSKISDGSSSHSPPGVGSKNLKHMSNSRKRKPSEDDDDTLLNDQYEERPGVKKSAHNMIEKRYRNNLNDKIAALRDAVPSLRIVCRTTSDGEENETEDLEGLAPAHKLNKATVLSKATEYIRHLEKHKSRQEQEINELRARLSTIERMVKSGRQVFHSPLATPNDMVFQEEVMTAGSALASSSQASPNGMIPIPESIRNMRQSQPNQDSYNIPHTSYPIYSATTGTTLQPNTSQRPNGVSRNGLFGRVMLTGLTTMMLLEGLREEEQQGDDIEARGLFSVPIPYLNSWMPQHASSSFSHIARASFVDLIRVLLLFASVCYIIAPLFGPRASRKQCLARHVVKTKYSLASPIELRQTAWLTAVQTVWVPSRILILELAALCLKMTKLSIRKTFGFSVYAMLSGSSREQETARIKAWRIALDAQLSGGDAEISTSRLLLTFLASGTLPSTPACLMLKALHIRVLLWNFTYSGYASLRLVDGLSRRLSRVYWNAARTAHLVKHDEDAPIDEDYNLPEHLSKLLGLDSDEVLIDELIQRCHNLAYNRPTANLNETDDSMDSVVEDVHIASPLDALAAWWSTLVVNRILTHVVEVPKSDAQDLLDDMELALQVAPPPSAARIRASVAKAIINKTDRNACIQEALDILPYPYHQSENKGSSPAQSGVNIVAEGPVSAEVSIALAIVKCLALAESTSPTAQTLAKSFIKNNFCLRRSASLLTFTAALQLLQHYLDSRDGTADVFAGLEGLSSSLRVLSGGVSGSKLRLSDHARTKAVERCLSASKLLAGVVDIDTASDQGYASQVDDIDASLPTEPQKSMSRSSSVSDI